MSFFSLPGYVYNALFFHIGGFMSRFLVAVLFFAWFTHASAADLQTGLAQCRGIQSLALRLQCYDRLADGLPALPISSTSAKTASAALGSKTPITDNKTTEAVVARPAPAKVAPEEMFGKSESEVQEVVSRELEIESIDQISSKVTRISISPTNEYVVYLENGQVWRQKDKPGKWRIKVGETAIISKAYLGSYLMKSDARKKSVRAERLR
tara:strand:+ start:47316 stop:47945 length:630 start_codon:yes stop_codon:yes gene_type:complete